MFRSLTLFCVVSVFALSPLLAQDASAKPDNNSPEKIKATPEILSLLNESVLSLTPVEPKLRAGGLFQLLGFAVNLEEKTHARTIVDALLAIAPTIEPVELRSQLYEGVASVLCDLEEYTEAVGVLNRIVEPANRYKVQLNLGVRLVREREEDKTLKSFDASELLRGAATGAAGANDAHLETAARIFLGRELARQDKQPESVAAFAEAMKAAQKIESADQKADIIGILFQSQVMYNQMAEARATLQTISNPDYRQLCVEVLLQHEQFDDAEKLLKTFPADEKRDVLLHGYVIENIKTITEAKIGEFMALVSSDEQRERFLQRLITELQKNDRGDLAAQVGKRAKDASHTQLALLLGKVEWLLGKKQFEEAVQFVDQSEVDEAIRQHLKRRILMELYQETRDESVATKIAEAYSSGEKIAIAELNAEAKKAAQITNFDEQMELFMEILQEQFQLVDIAGARQTMVLISNRLDKETEPVRLIRYRLLLARLQAEVRDNQKLKENLGKLTQMLLTVNDLKVLKDLVPQQPQQAPTVTEAGRMKLDLPGGTPAVDEAAIRDQLFQAYLLTASLLAKAEAKAESKAAFDKAKELATRDSNAAQKSEKLLILAQFLAEDQR